MAATSFSVVLYPCSTYEKVVEMKAMIRSFISWSWARQAPASVSEASTYNLRVCTEWSWYIKTGGSFKAISNNNSNEFWHLSVHFKVLFPSNSNNGLAFSEQCSICLWYKCIIPRNCCSYLMVLGTENFIIPCRVASNRMIPCSEAICPKYWNSFLNLSILDGLILNPVSSKALKTFSNVSRCLSYFAYDDNIQIYHTFTPGNMC